MGEVLGGGGGPRPSAGREYLITWILDARGGSGIRDGFRKPQRVASIGGPWSWGGVGRGRVGC